MSDWRDPIRAHHEETYWLGPMGDVERGNRWFVDQDGYERITGGMACLHCLTPFPAPVGEVFLSFWKTAEFRFPFGQEEALKLIAQERCPICRCDQDRETQITKPHKFGDEIKDPVKA